MSPSSATRVPVLLIAAAIVACGRAPASSEGVVLSQSCSVEIPGSPPISGGAISDKGEIVLWSRTAFRAWLSGRNDTIARDVALRPGTEIVGGSFMKGGALELFDGPRREVIRVAPDGRAHTGRMIPVALTVHAATRSGPAWILGGISFDGNAALAIAHDDSTRSVEVIRIVHPTIDSLAGDGLFLRSTRAHGVIAAWSRRPYPIAYVNLDGGFRWLPDIPAEHRQPLTSTEQGWNLWSALAAFSLSDGAVLQTLADLGGDKRVLFIRDTAGAVLRQTSIQGPMGLISASPSGKLVLGFTRSPVALALCYRTSGS